MRLHLTRGNTYAWVSSEADVLAELPPGRSCVPTSDFSLAGREEIDVVNVDLSKCWELLASITKW